jgi:hypothetical protein
MPARVVLDPLHPTVEFGIQRESGSPREGCFVFPKGRCIR